jgi:peptide/nickel transport system substrate-binding protein
MKPTAFRLTALFAACCLVVHVWAAAAQNTLLLGKSGDPDNLDPAVTMTNNSWTVVYPAYERLVKFKVVNGKGTTDVAPELATSWKASPDGLDYTFTLASGHRFADGSPVDAKAVKASFERTLQIKKGPSESFEAVQSIDTPDDKTVHFKLGKPFAPFLSALASDAGSVVSPAVMQHQVNGDMGQAYLADHTMGSGAYQVASWEKDQQIVLSLNPNYQGKKPAFDQVVVKIIADASARRLQLEKGDLDIAEDIPLDQLSAMKKEHDVAVIDQPSFSSTYLYLNNRHAPFNDARVRQAISYAVDDQGIIQGILMGEAVKMRGPIPLGMWGHDDQVKQYGLDIQKAKDLLRAAGVKRIDVGYLYARTDPTWEAIGLVLQQNLAPLGIHVVMQEAAYPAMRDKIDKGDFDIAVGNWTPDYGDPSQFMNFWFDSDRMGLAGNRAFYKNDKVDQLIRQAAASVDQTQRSKLYMEAQRITVDDAPYVLLFQKNYQFAMRSDVKGYIYNPMLVQIWNFADMSKQ